MPRPGMTRVRRCPLVSVPVTVMPSAKALGIRRNRPLRAAAAILADALSLGDPPTTHRPVLAAAGPTLITLHEDFTCDVMSQLWEEWRLRRGAVLRWVRGGTPSTASPACPRQLPSCRPSALILAPA